MTNKSYLDLSTGHLTKETMDNLSYDTGRHGWPAMSIASYAYGAFVTVPDFKEADCSNLPDDLRAVLRHAYDEGCELVRFDADGEERDDLPTFEW